MPRDATNPAPLRSERLAVVATGAAFFMVILDTSVVNLALPSIAADLHVGLAGLQWIVDGYALVLASLLLGAGSLGDRLGAKPVFLLGLIIFVGASALCGAAPTQSALYLARVLQGVGAALQLPTSLALLNHAVANPERRARAISAWAGAGALGIALGPVVGGVLVEAVGWRAIFLVNIPVGALGVWLAWRAVPPSPRAASRRLDVPGQLLAIISLAALTFALIEGGHIGWLAWPVAGAAGLFALAAAAFVAVEAHPGTVEAMLPLRLFRRSAFSATAAIGLLHNVGVYGQIFVLSLAFQDLRGASPLRAGLLLLPLTGAIAVGTRVGARLVARSRQPMPALPLAAGHLVGAAGALALAAAGPDGGAPILAPALLVLGLGVGTTTPAMSIAILRAVERERSGLAAGVLNAARQTGGVIGVAVLGALVGSPASAAGVSFGSFLGATMLALAGALAIAVFRDASARDPSTVPAVAAAPGERPS
jgi:MFS transporter, DHA2 family, methylenomycin A resistance protein